MGFYDDEPDLFDTKVKGGFYGADSGGEEKRAGEERPSLSFKWWEWAILAVEVGLVAYTVLVLLGFAKLF